MAVAPAAGLAWAGPTPGCSCHQRLWLSLAFIQAACSLARCPLLQG